MVAELLSKALAAEVPANVVRALAVPEPVASAPPTVYEACAGASSDGRPQ
jgi:hypothetical protein